MGRIDYRTKEGQEEEVLAQVLEHGGFSVFWVTENQRRAHAAERLQDCGSIIRDGGAYPWCAYKVPNAQVEPVVRCENPHWVGGLPAWDITLTDGDTHKDVTRVEIGLALCGLCMRGELFEYAAYIDVVRKCHIDGYNKYHTSIQRPQ